MTISQRTPPGTAQVLHGLGELAVYVPYVLGFHPTDSLVVLGSGSCGLGAVARADVADDPAAQRDGSDRVLAQMARAAPEWFEALLFDDSVVGRDLLRGVGARLRRELGPVHHLVVVRPGAGAAGRWQVADCRCGRNCDSRWRELPPPDRIPLVADRVLEGHRPAPSRVALQASLRARPSVARAVRAVQQPPPDLERYAQSLVQVLDLTDTAVPVERLPVGVLRDVLDGLLDREVRDHLLGWLVPGAMDDLPERADLSAALRAAGGRPWPRDGDPARSPCMQQRLTGLVTCAPDDVLPAPATVLGYWCWAHGGGALATMALERALRVAPGYRLAQLLLQAVQHGVRPDQLRGRGGGVAG